jgi:peptide/bleomycin uptake transporter
MMVRTQLIRSFFMSRKWAWIAWGGALVMPIILLVRVQLFVVLTNTLNVVGNIYQKASQHESGLSEAYVNCLPTLTYICVGFAALEIALAFVKQCYGICWWRALAQWFHGQLASYHKLIQVEHVPQKVSKSLREMVRLLVGEVYEPIWDVLLTSYSFFPILWSLSPEFKFRTSGMLLWIVLLLTALDTVLSCLVGRHLLALKAASEAHEAGHNAELVRLMQEAPASVTQSLEQLTERADVILQTGLRTAMHQMFVNLWMSPYAQFCMHAPAILLGLYVVGGQVSYGVLLQTTAALAAVQGAWSVVANKWATTLTDLATHWSLPRELEVALVEAKEKAAMVARQTTSTNVVRMTPRMVIRDRRPLSSVRERRL